MDALTRVSLSQQAAQALSDEITASRWEVGKQSLDEMALSVELNVGRSTIREAIRHLAAPRVLTTRLCIGVFVASTAVADRWNRLAGIGKITELGQVRVAIESRAVALADLCHEDGDADSIRRALDERNSLVGGAPAELAASDNRSHREIVKAVGNTLPLALFDSLQERLIAA